MENLVHPKALQYNITFKKTLRQYIHKYIYVDSIVKIYSGEIPWELILVLILY